MANQSSKILNNVDLRVQGHRRVKDLMTAKDFTAAQMEAQKVLGEYGPHIGVLIDLASSAYLGKNFSFFLIATKDAASEFSRIKSQLSDRSYMKSCLALGKLLEEIGFVSEALELFDSAISDRPFLRSSNLSFYQKIQIQRLRIKSFIGGFEGLAEIYLECFDFKLSDLS